jgi:hypothetical protein
MYLFMINTYGVTHALVRVIDAGKTYGSAMGGYQRARFTTQNPCSSWCMVSFPCIFDGIHEHVNKTTSRLA